MPLTPLEVAEQVRRMVAGEGVVFADLFARDGVLVYPFAPPGTPAELVHHGWSRAAGAPYRFTALGVIRVRDGQIVRYEDYMDPIAMARLLGRTADLVAALAGS